MMILQVATFVPNLLHFENRDFGFFIDYPVQIFEKYNPSKTIEDDNRALSFYSGVDFHEIFCSRFLM